MKLNKKGFTLVELLATIVILAIVMSITAVVSLDAYNASKIKSEKVFVNKLNKLIDDYIALDGSDYRINNSDTSNAENIYFKKCTTKAGESEKCNPYYAFLMKDKSNSTKIPFSVLIDEKLINVDDFVNPYDKSTCSTALNEDNNYIQIYKDKDSVFYFRYKLACISENNNNTLKEDGTEADCVKDNTCYVYDNIPKTQS